MKAFANKFLSGAFFLVFFLLLSSLSFAEELKIVFSGQSYSMLYPCSCPHEPDGGVLRRSTFLKNIRQSAKNILVVEAGNSFATGSEDQQAQNVEFDRNRTEIYLNALNQMTYDALLIAGQEYVFGEDFLVQPSHKDLPFLSSNLEGFGRPDVIKSFGTFKVGVLGLTDEGAKAKGAGKRWQAPETVLKDRIAELKKQGAALIVVLSSLPPEEDKKIFREIKGVDVVINGCASFGSVNLIEEENVIYLTTWWQARRMGVLTLDVVDGKIAKKNLESVRLSSDIADDQVLAPFVPACFQDGDCARKAGFACQCENGSTPQARCNYSAMPVLGLTVIAPVLCYACHTSEVVGNLQKVFGDVKVNYLEEGDAAAQALIQEFKLSMLPAYVFSLDIEKSALYNSWKNHLQKGKEGYLLKPERSGVSYLLNRTRSSHTLDFFFNFQYPQLPQLLALLKEFKTKHPEVKLNFHFLAVQDEEGKFIARGGLSEEEEFLRVACIDKISPAKVLDYLICRAVSKESSWWDECAATGKLDVAKIKTCARTRQGVDLMIKKIALTAELQVATGPTFVVDNQEIFSVMNVPSFAEFEKAVMGEKKEKTQ